MKNRTHSVEQKLYEAFRNKTRVVLEFHDVVSLMRDDAVATRVANTAAAEVDVETLGLPGQVNSLSFAESHTWKQLKVHILKNGEV